MEVLKIMKLASLILNLLSIAPHVAEDVIDAIAELKKDKNGVDKASAALTAAEHIAGHLRDGLEPETPK